MPRKVRALAPAQTREARRQLKEIAERERAIAEQEASRKDLHVRLDLTLYSRVLSACERLELTIEETVRSLLRKALEGFEQQTVFADQRATYRSPLPSPRVPVTWQPEAVSFPEPKVGSMKLPAGMPSGYTAPADPDLPPEAPEPEQEEIPL